jgi:hypothetical protein
VNLLAAVAVGAVLAGTTAGVAEHTGHLGQVDSVLVALHLHDQSTPSSGGGITGHTVTNLLWLPAALRQAGLVVVEEAGWRTRGHDTPMRARAVVLHHDASEPGPSPDVAGYLVAGFRSGTDRHYDAQLWVDRAGRWHIIAAGAAQHAGAGAGRADEGNIDSFGVETDHTTGEAWPAVQLDSIRRGLAAICRKAGWRPAVSVVAHREYAPGRKSDPAGIDMNLLRRQVTVLAGGR